MEGKILGVAVDLDRLLEPDMAEKYENSVGELAEKIFRARECERGSEGIRIQCQAVIDAFVDIFGEEKAVEILGERTNLLRCLDAFEEYIRLFPEYVYPELEKRLEKYDRGRLEGR